MSDQLCVQCHDFFGSAATRFMCSSCYAYSMTQCRKIKHIETISKEVNKFELPSLPEQKQTNHKICFKCSRKIGLLGYRCKACDCSYCSGHRLPEDHDCNINYHENAKKEMQRNNPNITASKIEQI